VKAGLIPVSFKKVPSGQIMD